jgi:hypothetical protein
MFNHVRNRTCASLLREGPEPVAAKMGTMPIPVLEIALYWGYAERRINSRRWSGAAAIRPRLDHLTTAKNLRLPNVFAGFSP